MKIVPLGANLVVKRFDAAETTAGGVILPDAAKQKLSEGRVLSLGDGRVLPNGSPRRPSGERGRPRALRGLRGNGSRRQRR